MQKCALAAALCAACAGQVVLIQDAGVDDYMTTVLLSRRLDFDGEVIVNADSALPSSMQAADKLHQLLKEVRGQDSKLTLSNVRMFNAFPYAYRGDSEKVLNLTQLQSFPTTVHDPFESAEAWLEGYLTRTTNVTFVVTTAPTPLTELLMRRPALQEHVREVLWMAGAVKVPGNLEKGQFHWQNDKAEWNVFTDPYAAADLVRLLPEKTVLFPLDIADQTPIDQHFYNVIEQAIAKAVPGTPRYKLLSLVLAAYKVVGPPNHPFYRLWDTITAGYLLWPELYAPPQPTTLQIVTSTEVGANQGWTKPCAAVSHVCKSVRVAYDFKDMASLEAFIERVAEA
eukprot:TRINITY_DN18030_c0_g1_i1.p1 TRINITY_DN18030_c0_g1~~TRINITY_DN18030_c0_g1_i1.p1  ORF type:complete len:340 (+),score=92.81 TRINITY_DN18030_c0_g1_i1:57-1076(+)